MKIIAILSLSIIAAISFSAGEQYGSSIADADAKITAEIVEGGYEEAIFLLQTRLDICIAKEGKAND